MLSRSVQPILWRISEALLEKQSAHGAPGMDATMPAPGGGPLTLRLLALAEDLVLQAPAPLQTVLSACQSFPAGWQVPETWR